MEVWTLFLFRLNNKRIEAFYVKLASIDINFRRVQNQNFESTKTKGTWVCEKDKIKLRSRFVNPFAAVVNLNSHWTNWCGFNGVQFSKCEKYSSENFLSLCDSLMHANYEMNHVLYLMFSLSTFVTFLEMTRYVNLNFNEPIGIVYYISDQRRNELLWSRRIIFNH